MAGRIGALLGCALLASFYPSLGGCARQNAPSQTRRIAAPHVTPSARTSTAHVAPTMGPPPARTATPTSMPIASATPLRVAPDAPPQILAVNMNGTVRSGELVSGTVATSSNVGSVEVRLGNTGTWAVHAGVGLYALSYRVPRLPFFLRGHTFTIQIIARNARGDQAERDVTVTVR